MNTNTYTRTIPWTSKTRCISTWCCCTMNYNTLKICNFVTCLIYWVISCIRLNYIKIIKSTYIFCSRWITTTIIIRTITTATIIITPEWWPVFVKFTCKNSFTCSTSKFTKERTKNIEYWSAYTRWTWFFTTRRWRTRTTATCWIIVIISIVVFIIFIIWVFITSWIIFFI